MAAILKATAILLFTVAPVQATCPSTNLNADSKGYPDWDKSWSALKLSLSPSSFCPVGWVNNLDKCYLTTLPKQDYVSCVSTCTNLGATLPCVINAAENKYLAGIFSSKMSNGMYLGLNDIVAEGTHQWQTGCASTYRNFLPGEPNNWHDAEDCTVLHNDGREMWNDVHCSMVAECVCEQRPPAGHSSWYSASAHRYDQETHGDHTASVFAAAPLSLFASRTVVPVAASDVPPCPEGWVNNSRKCYLATLPKQDYASCVSTCTNLGATPPCVMNSDESLYLATLYSDPYSPGPYVGLNDIVTEGSFQWQEGCASQYISFLPNEPNDFSGQEDCVVVYMDGRTLWNDVPCTTAAYCVCEKSAELQCSCADCAHFLSNSPTRVLLLLLLP